MAGKIQYYFAANKVVMQRIIQHYTKLSLISLAVVALLGCILRYKIAFSLPFINQKYLLHAHSHFAFAGWITQLLMTCLIGYLAKQQATTVNKKYACLLTANWVTALGMLLTFPWQGYGLFSIIFSTLSIFVSYFFAAVYWRDLNKLHVKNIAHRWFKLAILFNAVSSIGAFSLAIMMATKNMHAGLYMSAVYFFLHFQYNGWFFFACMGLFSSYMTDKGITLQYMKPVFALFAMAVVPVYLLSILWVHLPVWVYAMAVLAAVAQCVGLVLLLVNVKRVISHVADGVPKLALRLAGFAVIALAIKLALQLLSVIPSLNQLVFGFRPIVIGYLHLVFLGIITLFLLSFSVQQQYIILTPKTATAIYVFTAGIITNEVLLMLQGVCDLWYVNIPFINEALLAAALIMFAGILCIVVYQYKKPAQITPY